jgi:hypothetical protein
MAMMENRRPPPGAGSEPMEVHYTPRQPVSNARTVLRLSIVLIAAGTLIFIARTLF